MILIHIDLHRNGKFPIHLFFIMGFYALFWIFIFSADNLRNKSLFFVCLFSVCSSSYSFGLLAFRALSAAWIDFWICEQCNTLANDHHVNECKKKKKKPKKNVFVCMLWMAFWLKFENQSGTESLMSFFRHLSSMVTCEKWLIQD